MALVNMVGGVPTQNQSMYSGDANYKRAWDDYSAEHQKAYGSGYTDQSNSGVIEREVQNRMNSYGAQQPAAAQPTAVQAGAAGAPSAALSGASALQAGALQPGQSNAQFGAAAGAADPWAQQRGQYQGALNQLMQGGVSGVANDPSVMARQQAGEQALSRSMAARGYLGSGNILNELQKQGQDIASQEYGNQFARLSKLAGVDSSNPGAAGGIMAQAPGQNLAEQQAGFNQNASAQKTAFDQNIQSQKLPYELTALQQGSQLGQQQLSANSLQDQLNQQKLASGNINAQMEQQSLSDMQLAARQKQAELMKQVNAPTMAPSNSYASTGTGFFGGTVPVQGYAPVAPTAQVQQQRRMDLGLVPYLSSMGSNNNYLSSFGSLV